MVTRRSLPVLALAAAFLLPLGCGRADLSTGKAVVTAPLRVVVPPIPDNEQAFYSLKVSGVEVGRRFQSTTHQLHCDVTPAFVFLAVERITTGSVDRVDSSIVWATRDSLKPIAAYHFTTVGQAMTTTAAMYRPGALIVSRYSPQHGQQSAPVAIGPGTYDIDQLVALGRGLQIGAGEVVDIAVANPPGAKIVRASVKPGPGGTVTVPAGSFECYAVTFEMPGAGLVAWYETTGAHRVIRYESSDGWLVELLPTPK